MCLQIQKYITSNTKLIYKIWVLWKGSGLHSADVNINPIPVLTKHTKGYVKEILIM